MATKKSPVRNPSVPQRAERKHLCPYCNHSKKVSDFYISGDPMLRTGHTVMCKECARKIALQWDDDAQQFGECTVESVKEALERLDKPFLKNIWESSYYEYNANNPLRQNIWDAYIKNISMPQFLTMRWRDGDIYDAIKETTEAELMDKVEMVAQIRHDDARDAEYHINRRDVIRMVGYDPFEKYPIEEDKPVLYAQLVNFIDDETKNDGMKMNAIIQIVQSFNQIQKINDAINELSANVTQLNQNNGVIKQHAETISKLLSGANALAKDNGISVNHNNSKSKGQNTLTGKMKELDLIGFRDAKINMYDIDYCKGMQQVAEISAKAQVDQIGFDENVISEIQGIRRELVDQLTAERDKAVERARVLLVENKDLKAFLQERGLIDESGQVIEDD